MKQLYGYTAPASSYPAYLQVFRTTDGEVEVYIRGAGQPTPSSIIVPEEALQGLIDALVAANGTRIFP